MKILYLTARQPYPYTKGDQLISYHQIKGLSKQHKVYLVSFYEDLYDECLNEMSKYCEEVILIKISSFSKLVSSLKTVINFNSIQSNLFYKSLINRKIHEIYKRIKPDVVHVLSFRMAEYFRKDSVNKSIGLVDSYSNNMEIRASKTQGILKLLWNLEYRLLKNYEKKVLKEYKKATLVSKRDTMFFDNKGIIVNPVGVNVDESLLNVYKGKNTSKDGINIIFQGNMSYYPNVNAVKYIVGKILPLLNKDINYNLYLVGGNPCHEVKKLENKNIKVVGYVKNMEEYLGFADIALYPIFEATGMQTKVLEAMASKVPCIISPQCLDGIEGLAHDENLIVADNEIAFVKGINMLYKDKVIKDRLVNNAYNLIHKSYSWENNISTLIKLWEDEG